MSVKSKLAKYVVLVCVRKTNCDEPAVSVTTIDRSAAQKMDKVQSTAQADGCATTGESFCPDFKHV